MFFLPTGDFRPRLHWAPGKPDVGFLGWEVVPSLRDSRHQIAIISGLPYASSPYQRKSMLPALISGKVLTCARCLCPECESFKTCHSERARWSERDEAGERNPKMRGPTTEVSGSFGRYFTLQELCFLRLSREFPASAWTEMSSGLACSNDYHSTSASSAGGQPILTSFSLSARSL